jgi:hypothetical protein
MNSWITMANEAGIPLEALAGHHGIPAAQTIRNVIPDREEAEIQKWIRRVTDLEISDIEGVALTGQNDLSAMGLKLLDGGTLAVDETLYASASSTLQTSLSAGIRIGYSDSAVSDLSTQIGNMLISGGFIQDRIDSEKSMQSYLNNRKTSLQEKLIGVQARYTAQYASLDALLFKLQGTSDSLKSALDGLTNSQKNG